MEEVTVPAPAPDEEEPKWVKDIRNPKYNPLDPAFDREAYRAHLLEEHAQVMANPNGVKWWLEPYDPLTDIFSEEYDVDADIDRHIEMAKDRKRFSDFLKKLSDSIKEAAEARQPLIDTLEKGTEIKKPDPDQETKEPEPEPKPKTPRDLAIEQGAIMTIHGRLTSPSTEEFQQAFTASAIKALPGKEGEGKYQIDENGQLCLFAPVDFAEVARLHGAFLSAIFSLAYETDEESQSLNFYVGTICRELGIDPRAYSTKRKGKSTNDPPETMQELRYKAIYREIAPFENFVGEINGVYYRILMFEKYDSRSEVMTVKAPYIFKLFEEMTGRADTTRHSQLNRLLHANVVNEANYAAVEVANRIINGLLRRGASKQDNTTEYRISYARLIADCPQFKAELDSIEKSHTQHKTQAYNVKLKRILETAYRIILEKSDAPARFKDLKINGVSTWESTYPKSGRKRAADFKTPTKSKLSTNLVITHNGYTT